MSKKALIVIGSFITIVLLFLVGPFLFGGQKASDNTKVPVGSKEGTIVFWNLFDEQDLYAGLIQEFENRNPGVRVIYKKYTSLSTYEEDFVNELAEGKGPDIIAIHPSWLLKHKGKLVPMPPKNFYYGNANTFKETFLGPAANDLIIKEKDAQTGQEYLDVYAIPTSMDSLGIIYNRDFLIKYAAKNTPSKNWNDFQEDVKKIVRKSSDGNNILRGGVALGDIDSISRSFEVILLMMLQNGVRFYDQTMQNVTILEPIYSSGRSINPGVDALTFFTSFAKSRNVNYSWNPLLVNEKPSDKDMGVFVKSKVGMIFGYSYYITELQRLANQYKTISSTDIIATENIRSSEIPQLVDEQSGQDTKVALANYFPLSVTKTSQNMQKSWEFINYLAQPDQQRFLFRKGKKLTSRFDLVDEQISDPLYGPFVRQNVYAKSVPIPSADKAYALLKEQFTGTLEGRVDEKAVLTALQKELQCQLAKINGVETQETACIDTSKAIQR